jgi:hypothetical protein
LSIGCSGAGLAADLGADNVFWYREDWESEELLEASVRSDQFSQLLSLMEVSSMPPSLEFRVVGERRGLEYVAALRGQPARPKGH